MPPPLASGRPRWDIEGRDWPHRTASRFVIVDRTQWHVQEMGSGPTVLLLHGTGAATHSWAGLMPILADHFRVIAPDLPGHGFTTVPSGLPLSLPEMARQVAKLLKALSATPVLMIGHSAGAAIALRMALDSSATAPPIVSINGALQPFPGLVGPLFQGLARTLFTNPLSAHAFAGAARDPARVARLIEGTGSKLDAGQLDLYARLFRRPGHIAGTLSMMANWDLNALLRDMPRLTSPLCLVVGQADKAVPPSVAEAVRAPLPATRCVYLEGLGHLAHEERPDRVAAAVMDFATTNGLVPETTS